MIESSSLFVSHSDRRVVIYISVEASGTGQFGNVAQIKKGDFLHVHF